MARFPFFLSLALLLAVPILATPILATRCLAQQAPAADALPIVAVELDKIEWSKNPETGPLEFATIVGDRRKPGLYIQLVRWPPHAVYKAHSHPDDRYAVVLRGTSITGSATSSTKAKWRRGPRERFSPS